MDRLRIKSFNFDILDTNLETVLFISGNWYAHCYYINLKGKQNGSRYKALKLP